MGKKGKKFDQNALYELAKEAKGIKMKKKAVQFACCHKDKKGNFKLKPVKGTDFVFKCKVCKDKRVDLSILDQSKGTIKEQLKKAYRTFKSSADLIKLQSGKNDEEILMKTIDTLKKTYAYVKMATKVLKINKKAKKFNKRNVNVTNSGKSLFGRY